MGSFVIYTYVAVLLRSAADYEGPMISLGLFAFGAGAVAGTFIGGSVVDRIGPNRQLIGVLSGDGFVSAALSIVAFTASPAAVGPLMLILLLVWGIIGWGYMPGSRYGSWAWPRPWRLW